MNSDPSNALLFLGRFHPVLVHLPIGGLALLGILELLTAFTRWKDAAQNRRWILGFVSATAVMTAACGWMLAQDGGYSRQLLEWHRTAGLAVTGACLFTLLCNLLERPRAYRISLGSTLVLLAIASHLGGSITHGRGFLTRYAPARIRALLGTSTVQPARAPAAPNVLQQPVFSGVILPILQRRCSSCHGPEKHKGGLRLNSLEGLLAGGDNGPVLKTGHATDSPLIQRLKLPLGDDDHMPPAGKPQPTPEEIELLEWWINAGAPIAEGVTILKPNDRIRDRLTSVSQRSEPEK